MAIVYDPACEFIQRLDDEKREATSGRNPLARTVPLSGTVRSTCAGRWKRRPLRSSLYQPTSEKKGKKQPVMDSPSELSSLCAALLPLLVLGGSVYLCAPFLPGARKSAGDQSPCTAADGSRDDPDNDYWRKHDAQLLNHFPWLARFKEADLYLDRPHRAETASSSWAIPSPKVGTLMGRTVLSPASPSINRCISGQTTPQMVLRFHQDVIALNPKVVVILAGTNDIAGNTGPMTLIETENNLAAMAEMATANHIRVVLCSITPAFDYPWKPGLDSCTENR